MVKQYLKRRKLLQEQFERLMKELEEKNFLPKQGCELVDKALDIDRQLSAIYLVIAGIGIAFLRVILFKRRKING